MSSEFEALLPKQEEKRRVHVINVLDVSGSMNQGKDITISNYNEYLQVAKKQTVLNDLTFITFNSEVSIRYERQKPASVDELNSETYIPMGSTALYDALGLALSTASRFPDALDEQVSFLLQVFTDGEENTSKTHTASALKETIDSLQATGRWTISVLGPHGSIDLFVKRLGIPRGNVATFDPGSDISRGNAAFANTASVNGYYDAMERGLRSMSNTYAAVVPNGSVDGLDLFKPKEKIEVKAAWPFPTGKK